MNMKYILAAILTIIVGILFINVLFSDAPESLGADLRVFTVRQGGTGTSTVPSDGQVLTGQADGTYAPETFTAPGDGTSNWTIESGGLRTSTSTDYAKAAYFLATSSTGTSTFAGRVGIGTTTPATALHFVSSSYPQMRSGYSNTTYTTLGTTVNGHFVIGNSNVGIGEVTPGSKLSVLGGVGIGTATYSQATPPSNGAIIQGFVGIGTTSPSRLLTIQGGDLWLGGSLTATGTITVDQNTDEDAIYLDKDVTNANSTTQGLQIDHTSVVTDAGTYTKTGAALQINSNVTETSGTITDSAIVLDINQTHADATGNVVDISDAATGTGNALLITSARTTSPVIDFQGTGILSGNGNILRVYSNAVQTTSIGNVRFWNDNPSSTGLNVQMREDGSGTNLQLDTNGNGKSIDIDHDGNSASAITGLWVNTANAGAGAAYAAIFEAGRVGIGTTTPSSLLTVAGDTYIGGLLTAGSLTATNTLTIPYAADPTVDATGELALNTSTSSLRFYDGTAERQLKPEWSWGATFASSSLAYDGAFGQTGTTTVKRSGFKYGVTHSEYYCRTNSGEVTIVVGDGTASSSPIRCTTTGATDSTASNGAFTSREIILIAVGSANGTTTSDIYFDATARWTTD